MDKTVFEAAMTTATMNVANIKVITDITGTPIYVQGKSPRISVLMKGEGQ